MRQFYGITRDLHLYAGLFVSPFVLLYAASVFLLNHASSGIRSEPQKDSVVIQVMDRENTLELAKEVRQQLGLRGEIGFVTAISAGNRSPSRWNCLASASWCAWTSRQVLRVSSEPKAAWVMP